MRKKITFIYFSLFLNLILIFQNCSEVNFENSPSPSQGSNSNQTSDTNNNNNPHCDVNKPGDCNDTDQVLRSIQPTLAVSGISCLVCHAKINANVITDFGKQTSQFFGGNNAHINSASWYNNYVNTWQSAQINGQLTVPNERVPSHIQSSIAEFKSLPALTIEELMNKPYKSLNNWGGNAPDLADKEMSYGITAPDGKSKIVSKNEILISSPEEDEIFSLSEPLKNSNSTSAFFRNEINREPLELMIEGSGSQTYVKNDESKTLSCKKSNLFIKGTLFLKNLKVNAIGGCRLHVTGSVFIEGPISYSSLDLTENLQITSSNGIFMGFNETTLINRLLNDARNPELKGKQTYSERAQRAVSEAQKIAVLKDALVDAPVDAVTNKKNRLSYDYTHILLNAPMVHSRYLGLFKGTIISELGLFAIGKFQFEFDDIFTKVNVFPLLKSQILVVK